jgi:alpha-beta hydrolase superfamily lysophospholipase
MMQPPATFTASDGYAWRYRRYEPLIEPRARVVCVHGIQSHGGWYEQSSTRLCQAGYSVYFLDRRGSGLNEQARGDTPGFQRLLDDLAEFLRSPIIAAAAAAEDESKTAAKTCPQCGKPLVEKISRYGKFFGCSGHPECKYILAAGGTKSRATPVFLLAISWGGKLAVALQRAHPGLIDGLLLLCPGLFPRIRPSFLSRLAILASWLVAPSRLFPIPLNNPDLFTATPRWRDFIRNDPLALRQATARFLIESVRLDRYVKSVARDVTVPALLLLAGQDRIIRNDRTRTFVESFAHPDKMILTYPAAHHTLEFEPDPERFLGDVLRWLEAHGGRASGRTTP